MTVNEAVRALGTAIQADPRYQAYMQAKQANDANAALQEKLGAFHLKRMALQQESGKESADREKLMQLSIRCMQKLWKIPVCSSFSRPNSKWIAWCRKSTPLLHFVSMEKILLPVIRI